MRMRGLFPAPGSARDLWVSYGKDLVKLRDIGATHITLASALDQTMYHTQSNLLGPLYVGTQLVSKSDHVNPL